MTHRNKLATGGDHHTSKKESKPFQPTGILWFGDNLEILRVMKGEKVDLIYLDPPFNSKANYNVLYRTPKDKEPESQILAFEDTWHWGQQSEVYYSELLAAETEVASVVRGLVEALHKNDITAYLVMMAIRLVELHRVLKPTGSIYLHCDPTASHYLKVVMDAIFGAENFRNEIVWDRVRGLSSISKNFRKAHDVILRYAKTRDYTFVNQYMEIDEEYIKQFDKKDNLGRYTSAKLLVSGTRGGDTGKPWKGIDPNVRGKNGSHWICKREKLEELDRQGRVLWPKKKGGIPRVRYYLHESQGVKVSDVWTDISAIEANSKESLGYQTQKPLKLLERIIEASSKEGDVVLDPFCGCGTAVHAAQKLNRRWIGIDMTHLAIGLIEKRMQDAFSIKSEVNGVPHDMEGARDLARRDKLLFQHWAVMRIPNMRPNKKQASDKGIDGTGYIQLDKRTIKALVSVKGGDNVNPGMVRDLGGTMDAEGADMGILVLLAEPSRNMKEAAAKYGLFSTTVNDYPKLQIWTICEYFNGIMPTLPSLADFAKAPKSKTRDPGTQTTF